MTTENIFSSNRPDGRYLTTPSFLHHKLKMLQPRLAFDPNCSPRQFTAWKGQVRRKLRQLLTLPKVPRQPAPIMTSSEPRDGYTLQRWEVYPEPDSVIPVLVLVPNGASAQRPAPTVLCFPGSDHPKELLAGEPTGAFVDKFGVHNHMARHLVRAGFVAVAFDNPGTAELADARTEDWRRQSESLIWMARSYEGLSVFQKMAALEWVQKLPFVKRDAIAACGHSLGAKPALALGLLCPAIRAVVWNSAAFDFRTRHIVLNLKPVAPWQYIPGFIQWFDYIDLMAALAPTPLLVTEGGRSEDHRRIRRAYAITHAQGNFKVTYMPNFAAAAQRTLYRKRMPEGITAEEYCRYCSFDGDHYFKEDAAVPWLRRVLGAT